MKVTLDLLSIPFFKKSTRELFYYFQLIDDLQRFLECLHCGKSEGENDDRHNIFNTSRGSGDLFFE